MVSIRRRDGPSLYLVDITSSDAELRTSIATGGSRPLTAIIIDEADDSRRRRADTRLMNKEAHPELDAKLSAIEGRMDRRVERLERAEALRASAYRREQESRDRLYAERFEATSRRLEDRDKVIDSKLDAMNATISRVNDTVGGFSQHLDEKVKEVKSSNRNALLGILAIGAATVLGLWGANSTIIGSAASIFDSGGKQASQQQESQQLLRETQNLLKQIQLQAAPKSESRPAPAQ